MQLNCHTHYSLRYGAMSVEEFLSSASKTIERDSDGWGTLVLTDINTTSACLDFIRLAPEYKIKPIVGVDFRNGIQQQFIAIAQNNEGFLEINQLLTQYLKHNTPVPNRPPSLQHVFIIYPLQQYTNFPLKPWEFVGIKPKDLFSKAIRNNTIPMHRLVILQSGTFRHKKDYNAHRLLRAIDNNTLLSKLPVTEQADFDDIIMDHHTLMQRFQLYPRIINNTKFILETAHIAFDFKTPKNKKTFTGDAYEDYIKLQSLAYLGLSERYPNASKSTKNRMEKELETIHQLGFTAYFLINWDIIQYAHSKGYYHVGRGSGANSLVAYCLYITNVDPIDLDLYFERFINHNRKNPPDFDLDFSWTDRDDITEYIFQKHGTKHTALLATYNTFKDKSAIREIGKVFGLPKHEIDSLIYQPKNNLDQLSELTLKYSNVIQHYPNHLGIHAGGIVISEAPIYAYTAQNFPPKGFPTTQFSMYEAEDIGLNKYDILSQRGLGKIKDAITLVKENHNVDLSKDIENMDLLKSDPKIKEQLKKGATIGCFYVESPAMRMLLTKLKADDYKRLVAASSIIRPGVAKSGMMREYILRFQHPEKRIYAHPKLKELMEETYGVMVYQEDVLKVAHFFAGLTLEEADILRRGMSWKFRERNDFQNVQEKFFRNCATQKYDPALVKEVWRQIESFANYAFSKGHSASYAVESFQSLYIKAYYPLEYMVATLNNGGGFYRRESYIHEARMHGGNIHAPCINNSSYSSIIYEKEIFLGFEFIDQLEINTMQKIVENRQQFGSFNNLYELIKRVRPSKEQLNLLIRAGALRSFQKNKKELLWEACMLMGETPPQHHELFELEPKKFTIPPLHYHPHEDTHDEIELFGFPLASPFSIIEYHPKNCILAKNIHLYLNQEIEMLGYFVFRKSTKTSNGTIMYFGTFTDEEGLFIDTIHFPPYAQNFPFRGIGVYHLKGKVTEEFGFYTLEVNWMQQIPYIKDPRYD